MLRPRLLRSVRASAAGAYCGNWSRAELPETRGDPPVRSQERLKTEERGKKSHSLDRKNNSPQRQHRTGLYLCGGTVRERGGVREIGQANNHGRQHVTICIYTLECSLISLASCTLGMSSNWSTAYTWKSCKPHFSSQKHETPHAFMSRSGEVIPHALALHLTLRATFWSVSLQVAS